MSVSLEQLPWSSLELRQPEIPWEDLRALASAAAESPGVLHKMMDDLDALLKRREREEDEDWENLMDLAVPAVFALAAERLDEAGQRQAAAFLVHVLYRAAKEDNDWLLEAAERAAGRLGPAIVQPALSLLREYGSDIECWSYLCSLLEVAKNGDEPTRQAALEFCRDYIRSAPDRYEKWSSIDPAVWVLRDMDDKESLPLLRSIQEVALSPEVQEAIDILEEKPEAVADRPKPYWEDPVEEWLPRDVERLRQRLAEVDEETEEDAESDDLYGDDVEEESTSARWMLRDPEGEWGHRPHVRAEPKIGRNDSCPCQSGKKYKKCCGK